MSLFPEHSYGDCCLSKYLYLDASYFLCQTDIHWSLVEYSSSYSSSSEHQIFFVCVVSLSEKCPEWLHLIITLRLYLIIVNGLTSDILSDQYLSEVINKTILSSYSFILGLAFKKCILLLQFLCFFCSLIKIKIDVTFGWR